MNSIIREHPDPKVTLGLTNVFGYKNFKLSFFINDMSGFKIFNGAKAGLENPYGFLTLSGIGKKAINYWTPANTNTSIPGGVPNIYGNAFNSINTLRKLNRVSKQKCAESAL
jgi:hypothetical protein